MALNFSYCIFKTRDRLRDYFKAVRTSLKKDGLFVLDLYGGTEAIEAKLEPRDVAAFTAKDGTKVPAFEYITVPVFVSFVLLLIFNLDTDDILANASPRNP